MSWHDVTIGIPTVWERTRLLNELRARIHAECVGAILRIHTHVDGEPPRADFPALMDEAVTAGRPWILQLEDDVWLAPEFGSRAMAALKGGAARDADAIILFSRSRRDLACLERGEQWRRQGPAALSMSQGMFLRATIMWGFSAWATQWYRDHPHHQRAADLLLGAWLSRQRARVLVHVPSLVQHRRGPSTLSGHRGCRRSPSYTAAFGDSP